MAQIPLILCSAFSSFSPLFSFFADCIRCEQEVSMYSIAFDRRSSLVCCIKIQLIDSRLNYYQTVGSCKYFSFLLASPFRSISSLFLLCFKPQPFWLLCKRKIACISLNYFIFIHLQHFVWVYESINLFRTKTNERFHHVHRGANYAKWPLGTAMRICMRHTKALHFYISAYVHEIHMCMCTHDAYYVRAHTHARAIKKNSGQLARNII